MTANGWGKTPVCGFLALVLCSGCASRITLNQAIATLDKDMAQAGVVNSEDALDNTAAFNQAVAYSQCLYKNPNPPIATITPGTKLTLKGSFTDTGKFGVGSLGPAPTGSLEYDVARGSEQDLDFPLAYVSLERLPDAYVNQQQTYLKALHDTGDPAEQSEKADVIAKSAAMRTYVKKLISHGVPSNCEDVLKGSPGVFSPMLQ